jgi:hypothetical protein
VISLSSTTKELPILEGRTGRTSAHLRNHPLMSRANWWAKDRLRCGESVFRNKQQRTVAGK